MKTLFLDLEETLLKDWFNPDPIHQDVIRNAIEKIKPDRIGIFSHAINDENDRKKFNEKLKPMLESEFNIQLEEGALFCPTIIELIKVVKKTRKIAELYSDEFHTFFDKAQSFMLFVEDVFEERPGLNDEYILIDDAVRSKFIQSEHRMIRIISLHDLIKANQT